MDQTNNTDINISTPTTDTHTIDSDLYPIPSLSSVNSSTISSTSTSTTDVSSSESINNNHSNSNNNNSRSINGDKSTRTSNEIEYSADIRPLSFKVNKNPDTQTLHRGSHADLIDIQDDSLHSINYLKTNNNNNINNNNNNKIDFASSFNGSNTLQLKNYSIFDNDQFKSFLEKPKYIKIYRNIKHKTKNVGIFNKLFLAQELCINNVPTPLSTTTSNFNTNSLDRSNSRKMFNSGGGDGGGRPSISSLDSNNIHSNKHNRRNSCINNSTSHSNNNSINSSQYIMSLKFSVSGKYMAVGYKDGSIRVWKVISSPAERWELNNIIDGEHDLLLKNKRINQLTHNNININGNTPSFENSCSMKNENNESLSLYAPVFNPTPINSFIKGHVQDILDMDWSKNDFLITSSMDKTVKLWHIEKSQSLKSFSHLDFVTSVRFHPKDDRFFISGCLDHNVRLWSIIDNCVCFSYNCHDLITSLTISSNGGLTIVGTFNGFIHILETNTLTPITSFHVTDKSTQGIHSKRYEDMNLDGKVFKGPRITGIDFIDDETKGSRDRQIIVTSNDSRIRIFDIKAKKLLEYLKGFSSGSSQHLAQYVEYHNKGIVVCSSDDHWVYGWTLHSDRQSGSVIKDSFSDNEMGKAGNQETGKKMKNEVLNFLNSSSKLLPLKISKVIPNNISISDRLAKKNSRYLSFHAHHHAVTTTVIAPDTTSKILSLSNDFICELTLQYLRELKNNNELKDCKEYNKVNGKSKSLLEDKLMKSVMEYNLPDSASIIGPIIVTSDSHGIIRIFRFDMLQDVREGILAHLKKQDTIMRRNSSNINNNSSNSTTNSNSFDMMNQSVFSADRIMTKSTDLESKESNIVSSSENNYISKDKIASECNNGGNDKTKVKNISRIENISNQKSINSNKESKASSGICPRKSNVSSLFTKLSVGPELKSTSDSNRSTVKKDKSPVLNDACNGGIFPKISEEETSDYVTLNETYNASRSRNSTINSISALNMRCSTCNGTRFEPIRKKSLSQREMTYRCADCGTILNNFR